jgi:hypothetical protein
MDKFSFFGKIRERYSCPCVSLIKYYAMTTHEYGGSENIAPHFLTPTLDAFE